MNLVITQCMIFGIEVPSDLCISVSMESDHETRNHSSCGAAAAAAANTTAADAAALPNTPHSLCMKEGRLRLKGSSNPQRAPHAPVPSRQ